MRRSCLLFLLVASAAGCSSEGAAPGDGDETADGCSDLDDDGYGVGPECAGPDCDEANPYAHVCADCSVEPQGAGCPCSGGDPIVCYEGPPETRKTPPCLAGLRACHTGFWSSCRGQTLPAEELCDEVDNDCDGAVDEDVTNACGTCQPSCEETTFGDEAHPWNVEAEGSRGLVVEADGSLTLDSAAEIHPYIWIPNAGDGTVTKVDTRTREELGRYALGPARTAALGGISVNLDVDVVVSASISNVARVTRVNASDCGEGRTSMGGDDVREFGDDVCLAWSTELPFSGVTTIAWEARPVLEGLDLYVWVGNGNGQRVVELDADGELTGRDVLVAPVTPAGIAMDADGNLWVGAHGLMGTLTKIDPVHAMVEATYTNLGLKYDCVQADRDGKVWIAGIETSAAVFDQDTETFSNLGISAWGIAVDDVGSVWFGGQDGLIYQVDRDDLDHESFDVGLSTGFGEVYTAVDVDGMVWGVEKQTHVTANVFSPDAPEAFEIAVATLSGPGICGDMTGTQLLYVVEPSGVYRHIFDGCEDGTTRWLALRYDATLPGESELRFAARSADTLAALTQTEMVPLGTAPTDDPPLDLEAALSAVGMEFGALLELEVTLLAGRGEERPLLHEVAVQWACADLPD